MDTPKIIHYWLKGAEKDWTACRHLYESKDYPQCLFWGHLVIEKLLKALIVRETQNQAPYSHDLAFLASKISLKFSKEQKDLLNEITAFNQFGRYDSEILTFAEKCTPDYAKAYFNRIKTLYLWLKKSFNDK